MKNLFSLSDNALFSAVRGNSDGDGLCFSQVGKGLLVSGAGGRLLLYQSVRFYGAFVAVVGFGGCSFCRWV